MDRRQNTALHQLVTSPDKGGIYLNGIRMLAAHLDLGESRVSFCLLCFVINFLFFLEVKDAKGETALDLAIMRGDREAAQILVLLSPLSPLPSPLLRPPAPRLPSPLSPFPSPLLSPLLSLPLPPLPSPSPSPSSFSSFPSPFVSFLPLPLPLPPPSPPSAPSLLPLLLLSSPHSFILITNLFKTATSRSKAIYKNPGQTTMYDVQED